jgi:hypothetical protein
LSEANVYVNVTYMSGTVINQSEYEKS